MNLVCNYWVGTGNIEMGLGAAIGAARCVPGVLFFNISASNSRIGFPGHSAAWSCARSLKCRIF